MKFRGPADLPERRQLLYVSAPWARMTYAVLVPDSFHLTGPGDVAGKPLTTSRIVSVSAHTDPGAHSGEGRWKQAQVD
jgi:hypothetical protein